MNTTSTPSLRSLPEVVFGAAVGLELAVTAAGEHLATTEVTGLVLGAVVVAGSLVLSRRYAVGLALTAWGFLTGFLVNQGGQLTFAGADLRRAALFLGVALVASGAVAAAARARSASRAVEDRRVAVPLSGVR